MTIMILKKKTISIPLGILFVCGLLNIATNNRFSSGGPSLSTSNNGELRLPIFKSKQEEKRFLSENYIGRNLAEVDPMIYYNYYQDGECKDSSGEYYDSLVFSATTTPAYFQVTTLEECASTCSQKILLEEHRGFTYDNIKNKCLCHYDDSTIPLPLTKKISAPVYSNVGVGPIGGTDNAEGKACYTKNMASIGNAIDSYDSGECWSTSAADVVSYTLDPSQSTAEGCATKCIRFKIFGMHFAFEHQGSQCDCLFTEGDAPLDRYLSGRVGEEMDVDSNNKPFVRLESQSFTQRTTRVTTTSNGPVCYEKIGYEEPAESLRVSSDPNHKIWINEVHYRNEGEDQPFIEIIGPANGSADHYEIIAYQGRDGSESVKGSTKLDGLSFSEGIVDGWGFLSIDLASNGIRKGKLGGDGLALVYNGDTCLQFISYSHGSNRSFLAKGNACDGKASTPMGVKELRYTHANDSLQLSGGPEGGTDNYDEFTWTGPDTNTKNARNHGQNLKFPGPGTV